MSTERHQRHLTRDQVNTALTKTIDVIATANTFVPSQFQGVLSITVSILGIIKDTVRNKEDCEELVKKCGWIHDVLRGTKWDERKDSITPLLSATLGELNDAIERVHVDIQHNLQRRLLARLWLSTVDKEKIQGWTAQLDDALKKYQTTLLLDVKNDTQKLLDNQANQTTILLAVENNTRQLLNRKKSMTLSKETPPPRPAIFCGRDGLVDRIRDILLNPGHRHVALLGTGGIGKTSLSKAVIDDTQIKDKFQDYRSFLRFDNIPYSQITYPVFCDRVAKALGVPTSGTHSPILECLEGQPTLLILDNAETFLDPKVQDASQIKRAIEEFGALSTVSILVTSRSKDLPHGLPWEKIEVPILEAPAAYDMFTEVYRYQEITSESRITLENLLLGVGYHPLTISLLANAADINEWTIGELDVRWNERHTQMLTMGQGKDENLADSIELSLNSPSIRAYGDYVKHVLYIIAFFPQGVQRTKFKTFFPSVPHIDELVNNLLRHSILLHHGRFITMLAPIRLHVMETISSLENNLLDAPRSHYYVEIHGIWNEDDAAKDMIGVEDVNIETLLAFDISKSTHPLAATLGACDDFLRGLELYKGRSTSLATILLAIDTSYSLPMRRTQIGCLSRLSAMARLQSNYILALEYQKTTHDLAHDATQEDLAISSLLEMADTRALLGQYRIAQQLLERARGMNGWDSIADSYDKGYAALITADVGQCINTGLTGFSLAELYLEAERRLLFYNVYSARLAGDRGAISFALIDGDTDSSRAVLAPRISAFHEDTAKRKSSDCFIYLAAVLLMEGAFEDAEQQLCFNRNYCLSFSDSNAIVDATLTLLYLAMVHIARLNTTEAKHLIDQAKEESLNHQFISHRCQWLSLYASGALEFVSGQLPEAQQTFERTKKYCESQQEFQIRAFSTRAMGEIAYRQRNIKQAITYFEGTVKICEEAGIVPSLLYRHRDLIFCGRTLPATCEGWPLFLEGQFPSA